MVWHEDEESREVGIYGEDGHGWYLLWTCKVETWHDWTGIEVPEEGEVEFELTPVKKPARRRRRKTKRKD